MLHNKKMLIVIIGFIVICAVSIYAIAAYNREKAAVEQKKDILHSLEQEAKNDPAVVINAFMWAVANDDAELIKKTSKITPEALDTGGIYGWVPTRITDMKLENKTKHYGYREYRVDFKARVGLLTYLKSAVFFKSGSSLKKAIASKYIGFIVYKETEDSPWMVGSYGLHL